ncbi:hypothetical protein, partial [Palleronia rufa]|uniref:hypothetical protein n=1 Tax=Palleronia rufa TaxID=1530186 RepID=UPI0039F0017D
VTSFTASILNSRLNFRLVISNLQFHGHDLIFVSTKPAAGHVIDFRRCMKDRQKSETDPERRCLARN